MWNSAVPTISVACVALALASAACEFSSSTPTRPTPDEHTLMCAGATDPIETGAPNADAFDCTILDSVKAHGHPDPMLVKAQIAQESSFDPFSTSPDSPCGDPPGWTDEESKSFGLTQVTPACNEGAALLLPNGHPNMAQDMASPDWATSVYNPGTNIDQGVQTMVRFLDTVTMNHPGCTATDYALMSAGAFNSGAGSVLGCRMFNARALTYVNAVLGHYSEFALAAGWPNRY